MQLWNERMGLQIATALNPFVNRLACIVTGVYVVFLYLELFVVETRNAVGYIHKISRRLGVERYVFQYMT